MHPLISDLSGLSDEELAKKISSLIMRVRSPLMHRNPDTYAQLVMILDSYQMENQRRIIASTQKFKEKNKDLADKIDIK